MKSNEMWCYRFSRQCVASIVVKKVSSDAAVGSDAATDCKLLLSQVKTAPTFPSKCCQN